MCFLLYAVELCCEKWGCLQLKFNKEVEEAKDANKQRLFFDSNGRLTKFRLMQTNINWPSVEIVTTSALPCLLWFSHAWVSKYGTSLIFFSNGSFQKSSYYSAAMLCRYFLSCSPLPTAVLVADSPPKYFFGFSNGNLSTKIPNNNGESFFCDLLLFLPLCVA